MQVKGGGIQGLSRVKEERVSAVKKVLTRSHLGFYDRVNLNFLTTTNKPEASVFIVR